MFDQSAYDEAENVFLTHLDGLDREERVKVIDDLIHRLNFERRVTLLSDEELEHMLDEGIHPNERAALDAVKDNKAVFEERVKMYARSKYFRKCAWIKYLNGDSDEKPFSSPSPKSEAVSA